MKNTPFENTHDCIATKHAYKRAKERLGWKKKVLDKMMLKAFDHGIRHKDAKGSFRKYLNKLWLEHKFCNNVRVYGENIFFFKNNLLITLYRIDNRYRKHLSYLR